MNADMVRLFGKPVRIKTHGCRHGEEAGRPIPPAVNIFVKLTNGCPARCPFCSNAEAAPVSSFDLDKLADILAEALGRGLVVHRLNLTGGEPSVVPQRVERVLELMERTAFRDIHVHLNTNGLTRAAQSLMQAQRLDSVSVSLHHYDPRRLGEIYGLPVSEETLRFEGVDPLKLNASCNLVRGYVDSTAEAHRMMDFCLERGLTRLGFVGLMPVNDYCRTHAVSLDVLRLENLPHCYFTESRHRGADCRCSNYLYNRDGRLLDIYLRHYANPHYCHSSLLFDGEHLRQGFFGDNIIC